MCANALTLKSPSVGSMHVAQPTESPMVWLRTTVAPSSRAVASGATATGRRRPFAIIAGLVASFTAFTLAASSLLSALGLPQDFLRNLAIAALFVLAATLLVPQVGYLLERPLAFMTRRRGGD